MIKRAHDDFLTYLKVGYTVAHCINNAGHFVAYDPVQTNAGIHIAVIHMHIRAANAAECDAHSDLSCGGRRGAGLLYLEGLVAAIKGSVDCLITHRKSLRLCH